MELALSINNFIPLILALGRSSSTFFIRFGSTFSVKNVGFTLLPLSEGICKTIPLLLKKIVYMTFGFLKSGLGIWAGLSSPLTHDRILYLL